ncbi:MAG: DUF3090 family protein [Anaerolineae bacterium]|nr:DUF3090 family protein [Anaerolineae bacterium]
MAASPQFLALSQVDFITIGALGEPGQRTFFLQAAQGDLLISLVIEKEHAAALSIGIQQLIHQLGGLPEGTLLPTHLDLRQPLRPLFRVSKMGLGYDVERDAVVIVSQALATGEADAADLPEVHFWVSRAQAMALADQAAAVVAAGRPHCALCQEVLVPGTEHVCVRGNGHKWLYRFDE